MMQEKQSLSYALIVLVVVGLGIGTLLFFVGQWLAPHFFK